MAYPLKQFKLGNFIGIVGTAVKDANISNTPSGIKVCKFSLNIGKDETKEQGKQGVLVSCEVWRELSDYAENIKQGDTIFAIGTVKTSEYKGKEYTTFTAFWLNIAKEFEQKILENLPQQTNNDTSAEQTATPTDDSALPF